MPFLGDAEDEIRDLEAHATRQQATASRVGMMYDNVTGSFAVPTEAEGARLYVLAKHLVDYQKKYWWMKAPLQYALAKTGVAPDSASAKIAAEIGAKVEADSGFGFQAPGTSVRAAAVAAAMAVSGQGAGYGGSYDWGHVLRDLDSDNTYNVHYGDSAQDSTTTLSMGDTGLEVPLDTQGSDQQKFLESRGVGTSSAYTAAREQAAAKVAELHDKVMSGEAEKDETLLYNHAQDIANMTDAQIDEAAQGLANPVTPVVRTAFMTLDAPLQELQGQVRNVYGATHGESPDWFESQSDLGVAADSLLSGEGVDVGTGMFVDPNSEVAKERQKRVLERGNIGGHGVTLGRWGADVVFEPGSQPYNVLSGAVDLGVALVADPANIGLAKLGKLRAESKLFTESGGLLGLRKTVSPAAVEKFWDGGVGQAVAEKAASLTNTYDVWEAFGRKIEPATAAAIADETNPSKIIDILKPLSGGVLREKPNLEHIGGITDRAKAMMTGDEIGAVRSRQSVRMSNIVPGAHIDLDDPAGAVTQVERFLRNVKAPEPMVYDMVDKMSRAPDRLTRFGVLEDVMGGTKGLLVEKYGFSPERAKRLTTMFGDTTADARKYFVDEIGNTTTPWNRKLTVDGELVDLPSPHLLAEHIDRLVPLPDARALRRATSKYSFLTSTKDQQLRLPLAAMQSFQDNIWKPLALFRGAWTVRVVGEEQIRMGAAGLESVFRHPLSAISTITGRKGSVGLLNDDLGEVAAEMGALTRGSGGFLHRPGTMVTGDYKIAYKTPEQVTDYLHGWAGELAQLNADPVARTVAQFDTLDAAKGWFRSGDGQTFREQLARSGRDGHPELLTDTGADAYIESVAKRISIKTGDNPTLIEAIRTGALPVEGQPSRVARDAAKFNAAEYQDPGLLAPGTKGAIAHDMFVPSTTKLSDRFVQGLKPHIESGPQAVKTPRTRFVKGDALKERYDRVVENMFGFLMSKPSNYLSRSPAFKQFYWKRVEEMLPLMDDAAQTAVLRQAKAAKVDLKAAETSGEMTLEQADMLAKGHGLDETRGLLYDMSERSQFFDATRLLFPFGEAWKEVLTRWAKLAVERPQNIRRFQQIVQGARGPGFGDTVNQATGGVATGQGFFHQNDRGEEVFTYPGSEWLTSKLIGVPVPLVGRTQGLNMIGQIYPGLGPMAQIPAAWIIPDTPTFKDFRDFVFPYGEPGSPVDWTTWAPGWVKRIAQPEMGSDPEAMRLFSNSVMDVTRYLASTGDYDTSTPEGVQKMLEDAKSKAQQFNWIRGVAQNFVPSSPAPEFLLKDKDGRLVQMSILAAEYRALQNEDYATASQKFLDTYGTEPFLAMQSKTQAVSYGYPVTAEGLKWTEQHPDAEKLYPNVFGFFAPQGGEFDYNAYLRALGSGAKKPLTPQQFVYLGNARLASIQYAQAREKVGAKPSDAQRAALRVVQDALVKEYPGYGQSLNGGLGLAERADKTQQLRELTDAMKDPKLASTDSGQALTLYLQARDKVQAKATAAGYAGFQTSKAARPLRDALRAVGNALVNEHPAFAPLWEQILDREMNDDTDVEQAAA